jgi:biotin carboxyl carrier protein
VAAASSVAPATESRRHEPQAAPAPGNDPVASPGVGYFLYADGLGPGLEVRAGDVIGHVEVLGVRHDVRAPSDGVVRHLVAETGEAVEYGQTLVELERAR